MEGVEDGPARQRLAVVAEDLACGFGTVDDEDGDVAQLDLVDGAVAVRPLPVRLGRVGTDVRDVADERPAGWTGERAEAGLVAEVFIVEEVGQGKGK